MNSDSLIATVAGLLALSIVQNVQCRNYDVYYKWKVVEYNLPQNVHLNQSEYVVRNQLISMMKIFEDRMWLATPRFLRGVPVTLSTVPYYHRYHWLLPYILLHNESPKLEPFPSYEMNKIGDCNALQLVSALEIDQFGRLWVIDVGRINVLEPYHMQGASIDTCPAKLLIFDVTHGRSSLIFTYNFPEQVAPQTSSIMKEMQVACKTRDDCWAFMPDVSLGRLVVYDHKNRKSWTAQHPSMAPDPNKGIIVVDGAMTDVSPFGICGIALGPRKYDFSDLYFSPLASTTLYKVKTEYLTNEKLIENGTLQMGDVITLGEKPGQSDGFAMSSNGELFYGNIPGNSIISTETDPEMTAIDDQDIVAESEVDFLWPDSFSFDGDGKLALTSSKFHLIDHIDITDYNYRVLLLRHTGHVYAYNRCC